MPSNPIFTGPLACQISTMSSQSSGLRLTRTQRGSLRSSGLSRNTTAPSTSRGRGTSASYGRYSMRGVGAEGSVVAASDMRLTRLSRRVLLCGAAGKAHGYQPPALPPARQRLAPVNGGGDVVEQLEEQQPRLHAVVAKHIACQHGNHGLFNPQ